MQRKKMPSDFRSDIRASIVVFLVALPLAMGISIASGYPPEAGLITGIVGGILVGFLSGAPLQVSGAAAGLTVLVLQGVHQFGIERMGVVILAAGLIQVTAALSGLGRWFQAISPTVLHAMLAGIGVLIVASQFHVMMDLTPQRDGLSNLAAIPVALREMIAGSNQSTALAFAVGALAITIMIVWPKLSRGAMKRLPAPLVAVIACAVVAGFGGLSIQHVRIPADLLGKLGIIPLDFNAIIQTPAMFAFALQLALIASAESLLCAAAVDQMHSGPRAKFNKELAAQGIGNAVCGALGALPMTGVIVRSSANVDSGATSRLSTILHGAWLLLFVWLLPAVLKLIPIAALAGILVFTGVKLVNVRQIRSLVRHGRSELVIYLTTVTVVVTVDLLYGVLLGLAMSSLKLLRQLSHLSISVEPNPTVDGDYDVRLRGAATFLRLPKLATALERVPNGASVRIDARLQLLDAACREHLHAWQARHVSNGGRVVNL
jgi:MFS superfamily sulfate permease-like transporter